MQQVPKKGTEEYYVASVRFADKIITKIPEKVRYLLWFISVFSIISILALIFVNILHIEFFYRRHTHSDDMKFVFFLLFVWGPLLLIGWSWLVIIYSKYYANIMIEKLKRNK